MPRFNRLYLAAVVAAAFFATAAGIRTASAVASPQPRGVGGAWRLVFDDEFNGTAINFEKWSTHNGWFDQNNVTDHTRNVSVSGGHLHLTLASRYSGAAVGTQYFRLRVGEYAEARIRFAGRGRQIFNWPAWWAVEPNVQDSVGGENDIAEGLGGDLTVNYLSPSGSHNYGTVRGNWGGTFHTYGLYRGRDYCVVYWDGRPVRRYSTDDDGAPEQLLLTIGVSYNPSRIGPSGSVAVDYVRAWHRA